MAALLIDIVQCVWLTRSLRKLMQRTYVITQSGLIDRQRFEFYYTRGLVSSRARGRGSSFAEIGSCQGQGASERRLKHLN